MSLPTAAELDPAIEATWPAASHQTVGPFTLREGQAGGQRASAATAQGPASRADINAAARAMTEIGQRPIFRLRPGEDALDVALADAGFAAHDPTNILAAPTARIAELDLPRVRAFLIWPPLAIMDTLWTEGGIGPGRRAVMARAKVPKTAVLGRGADRPAGVAFAAICANVAMIHAVQVAPAVRRRKVAHHMMGALARWAQDLGVPWLATLCTCHNLAANSLYSELGFSLVAQYHFRVGAAGRETVSGQGSHEQEFPANGA